MRARSAGQVATYRSLLVLVVLAFVLTTHSIAAASTDDNFRAEGDQGGFLVEGTKKQPATSVAAVAGVGPPTEEFRRAPGFICGFDNVLRTRLRVNPECSAEIDRPAPAPECAPDERAVDPLFRRVQIANGGWSEWAVVQDAACVVDVDIRAAIAAEFQRLPVTPSPLSVQPPSGWTLVNVDTIVFTDDDDQLLATTVLGVGVTIRATPVRYTWDFGDGAEPLETTDAGHAWPEYTLAHRYQAEATHTIRLTTTWTGQFQLAGTATWEPVDGTVSTVTTSEPLTVYEARAHLVGGGTS